MHTRINQARKTLQCLGRRGLESDALALYGDGAAQLLAKKLFAVTEVADFSTDGIGDVLYGLRMVEVAGDFLLLRMRLSIRWDVSRIVRSLHRCGCAHTAGAGGADYAGHMLLGLAQWVGRRVWWTREDTIGR